MTLDLEEAVNIETWDAVWHAVHRPVRDVAFISDYGPLWNSIWDYLLPVNRYVVHSVYASVCTITYSYDT